MPTVVQYTSGTGAEWRIHCSKLVTVHTVHITRFITYYISHITDLYAYITRTYEKQTHTHTYSTTTDQLCNLFGTTQYFTKIYHSLVPQPKEEGEGWTSW